MGSRLELLRKLVASIVSEESASDSAYVFGFFPLIVTSGEPSEENDAESRFIRTELLVASSEGFPDVSDQIEELCDIDPDKGRSIGSLLLRLRNNSFDSALTSELDDVDTWWRGVDTRPSEADDAFSDIIKVIRCMKDTVPIERDVIKEASLSISPQKKNDVLADALDAIRNGDKHPAYLSSPFYNILMDCERLHDVIDVLLKRWDARLVKVIARECENVLTEIRCKSLEDRVQLASLLELDRTTDSYRAMLLVLSNVLEQLQNTTSPVVLFEQFKHWAHVHVGDARGSVAVRLLERAEVFFKRMFIQHLVGAAQGMPINSESIKNYSFIEMVDMNELAMAFDVNGHVPYFFFPEHLGGVSMSRRYALLRALIFPSFDLPESIDHLDSLHVLNKQELLSCANDLESKILTKWRTLWVERAQQTMRKLLTLQTLNDLEYPESRLFSVAFLKTLGRCQTVLGAVVKAREASMGDWEMFIFLLQLETFFKQSVEYAIWPPLLKTIETSLELSVIVETLVLSHSHLRKAFLLNQDVHYLALDNVIRAISAKDRHRFTKARAFLLRCLNASPEGERLVAYIDHNGYYRSCMTKDV